MPNGKADGLQGMYKYMYMARKTEDRLIELYRQGIVKGTVTTGTGNEAAIVGAVNALDPETDVCNFMQRDFAGYLAWGVPLYHMVCQYVANSDSPTGGKDGNVHHGLPERGLLPMVSHLGAMLPNVTGAVYAKRRRQIDAVGLAIIGDGGTSTGDFHESLNIASVLKIPVLFFIENNQWAYSTPNNLQFNCADLSSRAAGYGIKGSRIKAVDVELVSATVAEITAQMKKTGEPYLLQTDTYRLAGHAAYDTGEYVPAAELAMWKAEDPVLLARDRLVDSTGLEAVERLEHELDEYVAAEINRALETARIDPSSIGWEAYSRPQVSRKLPEKSLRGITPVQAVKEALDHLMANDDDVFLLGEDIGAFGGPFKATKGLFEKYGRERVLDMPLAESGFTGFAVGAAEMGLRPVVEMQFSDFSTDAVTQICVNAGSFFFRTGTPLPLVIRMPGGGGLSYGPFHSQDLEGLFGTFPGLKIVYPSLIEDYFALLIASVYDGNPVLFFENKYLQRRIKGDVAFDGNILPLEGARVHKSGTDLTLLSYGAMFHECLEAVSAVEKQHGVSVEVIDPRILKPLDWTTITESVRKTHRFLVVHESWSTCGMGSWIASGVAERAFFDLDAPPTVYAAPDLPVPFAPELEMKYRPGAEGIADKIRSIIKM
ncbi:MAG: dehydrogenase E1 component subunit alpha/beta [Spirochaetales bacterium]|nr:dehydrogenase E1 component subunit alpha/beta [Spirochaetales bacterium]